MSVAPPNRPAGDAEGFSLREALFRFVPAFASLRDYGGRVLAADTMAGLTVAAVAVPQAMAYAQIAGLPPQYGLYTAIVMTAAGALFSSSKQLINGPTNAISIAVLSALVAIGPEVPIQDRVNAAILLALLVGVIQLVISLLRLGDLSRYISHAVIVGFTLGAAVLLVLDQFKNLVGLKAQGTGKDLFLKRFWLTASQLDLQGFWTAPTYQTQRATLLVGLATIAIALTLRWVNRRLRIRLPDLLLAVVCAAAIVRFGGLHDLGVFTVGDIGEIPASLPAFKLPEFHLAQVRALAGGALTIALLGLLEAISMSKALAAKAHQKLDVNQLCLSEAVANMTGSFFQCYPGSGSLTRSTINQQAGARTQWSGVISAAAVALTVLLFAPYAKFVPTSGLAGVLIISAGRLVDWKQLKYYVRTTRFDAWIVALTAISVVAVSVEFCVLIGVFLSFVLYIPKAARVQLTELTLTPERIIRERVATDAPCGRIRIFNLEGELFFGAAPELEEHLETIADEVEGKIRVLVLRLKRVRNPDAVCLEIIDRFVRRMSDAQIPVILCGVRADLVKALAASELVERAGAENSPPFQGGAGGGSRSDPIHGSQLTPRPIHVFPEHDKVWSSTLEAIRFAYEIIGDDVCEICPRHAESLNDKEGWYYMI